MAYIDHTEGERVGGLVGRARNRLMTSLITRRSRSRHIWQIGSEDVCKSVRSASGGTRLPVWPIPSRAGGQHFRRQPLAHAGEFIHAVGGGVQRFAASARRPVREIRGGRVQRRTNVMSLFPTPRAFDRSTERCSKTLAMVSSDHCATRSSHGLVPFCSPASSTTAAVSTGRTVLSDGPCFMGWLVSSTSRSCT